jgi:hypothetical protein
MSASTTIGENQRRNVQIPAEAGQSLGIASLAGAGGGAPVGASPAPRTQFTA